MARRHAHLLLISGAAAAAGTVALTASGAIELAAAAAALTAALSGGGALVLRRAEDDARVTRLDERLQEMRQLEERLRARGVAPVELAYHHLLETGDPAAPIAGGQAPEDDDRQLERLIRARCDRVWQGIAERRYVKREGERLIDLDGGAIFAELKSIVEEVAALYHAPGDATGDATGSSAVLTARTGDIALAARAIAGELLQVIQRLPVVDPSTWTVAEVIQRLEQVEKGVDLYRRIQPYDHYLTGAMLGVRLMAGASPVSLAAWYLGKEGMKRAGTRVLKTRAEAWLKALLESSVAMVYLQVARTYAPRRTYRSADWFVLVETLAVQRTVSGVDHNRKVLLAHILKAPLGDDFARLELLRALAEDVAPDPRLGEEVDYTLLKPAALKAIAAGLKELLGQMRGLGADPARAALESLELRLGWGLGLDLEASGTALEARAADGFDELAHLACGYLELARPEARARLLASSLARALKLAPEVTSRIIDEALDRSPEAPQAGAEELPLAPPRSLVGDELAGPFVDSVAELLAAEGSWAFAHDHLIVLATTVLVSDPKRRQACWQRYLEQARSRLGELLVVPDSSSWPDRASPAVLREVSGSERPLAVLTATEGAHERWLALFNDRALIGHVPDSDLSLEPLEITVHPLAELRFERESNRLRDELHLRVDSRRLVVAGARSGSFERRFGTLLDVLDIDPQTMPRAPG